MKIAICGNRQFALIMSGHGFHNEANYLTAVVNLVEYYRNTTQLWLCFSEIKIQVNMLSYEQRRRWSRNFQFNVNPIFIHKLANLKNINKWSADIGQRPCGGGYLLLDYLGQPKKLFLIQVVFTWSIGPACLAVCQYWWIFWKIKYILVCKVRIGRRNSETCLLPAVPAARLSDIPHLTFCSLSNSNQ